MTYATVTTASIRYKGDFSGDFTQKLSDAINWLFRKAAGLDRQERMDAVQYLTDRYVAETGRRPKGVDLERMGTLILREELTDKSPHKMSRDEYPIMSDTQRDRRIKGAHSGRVNRKGVAKVLRTEVPLEVAYDFDTFGVSQRIPDRRRLSTDEGVRMDGALPRDASRREEYIEETKPGDVKLSYL